MIDSPSPPAERQKRLQDGISQVQKVVAVELGFRGAPGCFRGIWTYIGGRSRSVEPREAHEGGGRALGDKRASLPSGLLVDLLTSTPSPLDHVCSKNNSPEGFIPFDIPFLQNIEIGKKQQFGLGLRLIG